MDIDFQNYPHLSRFLMGLELAAQTKKQDRELEAEFGKIPGDEVE